MADFCKQCSIDMFGADYRDLAGLITPEEVYSGNEYPTVICEGCGFITVDPDGNCISDDCDLKGRPGHGCPRKED